MIGYRNDGYTADCVLPVAHGGPHEFVTPKGRRIAWEDDDSCGCCSPEEDDRCTVYWEVT